MFVAEYIRRRCWDIRDWVLSTRCSAMMYLKKAYEIVQQNNVERIQEKYRLIKIVKTVKYKEVDAIL